MTSLFVPHKIEIGMLLGTEAVPVHIAGLGNMQVHTC